LLRSVAEPATTPLVESRYAKARAGQAKRDGKRERQRASTPGLIHADRGSRLVVDAHRRHEPELFSPAESGGKHAALQTLRDPDGTLASRASTWSACASAPLWDHDSWEAPCSFRTCSPPMNQEALPWTRMRRGVRQSSAALGAVKAPEGWRTPKPGGSSGGARRGTASSFHEPPSRKGRPESCLLVLH
jgi:hypothetical protein